MHGLCHTNAAGLMLGVLNWVWDGTPFEDIFIFEHMTNLQDHFKFICCNFKIVRIVELSATGWTMISTGVELRPTEDLKWG
jgi:hypothetical protein